MTVTKECREREKTNKQTNHVCLFLLENSRHLSPLPEHQTLFSSSGILDFLSTCLGIDSLIMNNLDRILKSRDSTLPTKGCLVKAMVFPVVIYGCKSWTVKKVSAEELMLLTCGVGEDS